MTAQPSTRSYQERASSPGGTRGSRTALAAVERGKGMTGATPPRAAGLRSAADALRSVKIRRAESHIRDTSVFARSGGKCARGHGVSVLTGKTFLVDRGDTLI
ncbi:hypothetical protein Sros01_12580 [Streptomyces roseochromogenus]|nr:hypothetical protein Sros01_12580 [Streptomyces roseochromogenus]